MPETRRLPAALLIASNGFLSLVSLAALEDQVTGCDCRMAFCRFSGRI